MKNQLEPYGIQLKQDDKVVLITAHRRENFGGGIQNICNAVEHLAQAHPDLHFIWPVHLNPAVHDVVHDKLKDHSQIHLVKPLDYPSLLAVIDRSNFILTDSGGLQEESPSFNKPVLILRDTTERPEVVEVGAGVLVGTNQQKLLKKLKSYSPTNSIMKKWHMWKTHLAMGKLLNVFSIKLLNLMNRHNYDLRISSHLWFYSHDHK